ncbi:MAG: (2Fe-2S)-binding protein [Candidatus Marinimicrobia bacterium]|nr:(2Fe-2S)-binding protein [Candidatus Neomarinimicrobiota bacterium]MBL7022825.1 (2Fe-2S)-binding protein [Candidatus Neomarinimicrobiota bacterium]MBL7109454.1 (2Fe-2S)-binding protein [Candidatus Neomarinimicrobiota bacterium]
MGKYTVKFLPMDISVDVDSDEYPYSDHGESGSILDIALANDIDLFHNCGGVGACATCHIIVKNGMENLSEMDDDEADIIDEADGSTLNSRLGCQCVVQGDVTIEIPE